MREAVIQVVACQIKQLLSFCCQ